MKTGYTHISVVLDRSGSMQSIKKDTIGGFNSFLKGQKEAPGEATISLTQFDTEFMLSYSFTNIQEAPDLTEDSFQPRGMTALYDAIGITIKGCGEKLAALPEALRPEKVIFVIITDGEENSSREYSHARVSEMIKHQSEVYQWEFIFLGANIDAVKTAQALNIKGNHSMTFAANSAGVENVYASISKGTTMLRSMSKFDYDTFAADASASLFDDSDREKQKQAGA